MDDIENILQRREPLHADLVPYLDKTSLGVCLRHPLVYGLFYTEQSNAMYNEQYKAKKQHVERSLKEKDYSSYIWMHERPHRLQTFCKIMDELSDVDYWTLLANIWSDSENLWQYGSMLRFLVNSSRPGRDG